LNASTDFQDTHLFYWLIVGFAGKLTRKQQAEMSEAFASWLYITAIPFWIVDQQVTEHCVLKA